MEVQQRRGGGTAEERWRYSRGEVEVQQRRGVGTAEERWRYSRGEVEVQQRRGGGTAEERWRYSRGEVEVQQCICNDDSPSEFCSMSKKVPDAMICSIQVFI